MASLNDILIQRVRALQANPLAYVDGIQSQAISQLNEMINLLGHLDVDSKGMILNTSSNLQKIDTITQGLGDMYFNDEYIENLRGFASTFHDSLELNRQYLDQLGDFTDDELFEQAMRAGQKQTIQALSRSAVNNHMLEPLSSMLVNSVTTATRFSDTVDALKRHIGADPNVDGRWIRHAKQIAFDGYAISDRQTALLMAKNNNYRFYGYYGTVKDTTRCFCRARVGKVYSIEEYEAWGRKEDLGVCGTGTGWAGMNDATNEQNILSLMGGYNCRHVPAPEPGKQTPKRKKIATAPVEQVEPPPGTFVPAKDIKEGKRRMASSFRKRGLPTINGEFDPSIGVDKMNQRLEWIEKINAQYKTANSIDPDWKPKLSMKSTPAVNGNLRFANDNTLLEINLGHRTNSDRLGGRFDPNRFASLVDKDNLEVATLVHEMGHTVTVARGKQRFSPFWSEMRPLYNNYIEKTNKWNDMKNWLGSYSRTNIDEFFAEAWTEYHLSSNPAPIAKKVGALVDKHFKIK